MRGEARNPEIDNMDNNTDSAVSLLHKGILVSSVMFNTLEQPSTDHFYRAKQL